MVERRDGLDRRDDSKVSASEVYRLLELLKDQDEDRHRRLREDMQRGFAELRDQIALVGTNATDAKNRILTIEVERRTEAKYARRDGAIFGSLFGMLGTAVLALLAKWFKWSL